MAQAVLPADLARELVNRKLAQIPYEECRELENRVGQLFYINVDGFGSKHAIDPAYFRLVERIQPDAQCSA